MGDRWFDLGNLSVNNDFEDADEGRLLDAYHGEPPSLSAPRGLRLMRLMSDFREAMWGVVQGRLSDLDFDFAGYADDALRASAAATEAGPELRGLARGGAVAPRAELPDSRARRDRRRRRRRHLDRLPPRTARREDVVLLDRNELTSGSTFHSAGLVGQLRGSVSLTRMMMDSVELYRPTHSTPAGWSAAASASPAPRSAMEELRRQVGWAKTFGLPLELISAEEAKELFPLMDRRACSAAPTWRPTATSIRRC